MALEPNVGGNGLDSMPGWLMAGGTESAPENGQAVFNLRITTRVVFDEYGEETQMTPAGAEIHVGDVGTELVVRIANEDGESVDLRNASVLQIKLQKLGHVVVTKDAEIDTDGTDGRVKYVTEDGDIDAEGFWRIQGYAQVGSMKFHTSWMRFQVFPNL